jgi:hypothetical protein
MKSVAFVLPLTLLFPAFALAGNIFGSLTEGGRSVGAGVEVRIQCGTTPPASAVTDDYGAYSINVPSGRCELTVAYKGQVTPPFSVASSDDPARYDFELVVEGGRYLLKRR